MLLLDFSKIVFQLNAMLKKYAKIELTTKVKAAFKGIKKEIVDAPTLTSLDYKIYFTYVLLH